MKIAELFAYVGFQFDTLKLREFTKMLGDLNISSLVGVSSLAGLGVGIKKLIDETADLSSNLKTISDNTGIDPVFIQQLENVSKALGASKQEADGFLSSLSKAQLQIRMGKGNIQPFILGGLTYDDVVGSTENLVKKVNAVLSKSLQPGDTAGLERQKQFRAFLNEGFGASPNMLKVLGDPELAKKSLEFNTLNVEELKNARDAQYEWVKAVENLNVELQKTANTILPELTEALNSFTQGSGMKIVIDTLRATGILIDTIGKSASIAGTNIKAGWMNFQNDFIKEPAYKMRREEQQRNMVNNITLNVKSDTPEQFIKNFDPLFRKHLEKMFASADIPFGQST